MTVSVKVETVGVEKLVAKFDSYVGRLRPNLNKAMNVIVFTLVRYVQEQKLSGQVLHRRTGTLSRSIKGTVTDQPARIIGDVTSRSNGNAPLPYAVFWEKGFVGSMNVREHVRRTATGGFATVRQHIRNVNQAARPFFRPSKEENQGFIQQTLQNAVTITNKE